MKYTREIIGEMFGTFLLVLFGCGAVLVSVLFDAYRGLFQVAVVWGMGVTLAIYATRHLSCAHLNPAVSVAMVVGKRMSVSRLPAYLAAQFIGAYVAALVLYAMFSGSIGAYEMQNEIKRGTPASVQTAMMFGEFYPNPSAGPAAHVSYVNAFFAETVGTFVLVLLIFSLTEGCNVGRPDDRLAPLFVGLSIASVICLIAPLTQAGLNPARDLSPRVVAWAAGWGAAAFPDEHYGFLVIYGLGPMVGGVAASLLFVRMLEPLMKAQPCGTNC